MPEFPAIVITNVSPELDGGRYPVKRFAGDHFVVAADVLKDGHDRLQARLCVRGPGELEWRHIPMTYDEPEDRWSGAVVLHRIGRWTYTVEAWTDAFGTWADALEKKVAAGLEVPSELLEGAALLDAAGLGAAASRLRDPRVPEAERVRAALAPELRTEVDARQPRSDLTRHARELVVVVDRERARFAAWYEMFPRSQSTVPGRHGRFADAARRLPDLAALGFDVVYLPPIHPIGRVNRKGPNNALGAGPDDPGSPWAIGSDAGGHDAVEPALGTLADFERFVAAAHSLGMEVALDYALQCAPDHPWAREHPDWFFVRPDGTIKYAENPPKQYEDIYPLNFWCEDRDALWAACRDVVLFWVQRGVRIYRVDNPHTKPFAFWEWLIADVQREHPNVIFFSEAFTRPKRMKLLAKLGFTQSYTYFTWRNTAAELRDYLTELTRTEMVEYFRPNLFTNTPDILHEYLQKGGRPAFRVRLLLAATLSPAYGIYSGFELCERTPLRAGSEEYLHSEKYEIRVRDWQAPGNLRAEIGLLNRLRREHRALQVLTNLSFLPVENEQMLAYRKAAVDGGDDLLVVVNVDPQRVQEAMVHVPLEALGLGPEEPFGVEDLLTGDRYRWRGVRNYVRLDPSEKVGHVLRVLRQR